MGKIQKTSLISLIFFLSVSFAQASTLDNVKSGLSDLFSFFNNSFVQKIEGDFCNQYILSISNGLWTAGQIRTKVGEKICSNYKGSQNTVPETVNLNLPSENVLPVSQHENLPSNKIISTSSSGPTTAGENKIIFWTNYHRAQNGGLPGLSENRTLSQIAKIRVEDMFAKQYFEHTSPSGDSASKEASSVGYKYITIGENIALGNFGGVEGLLTAWMNSPGHRANILNKNYTEIGIASEEGIYNGKPVSISAQIFGKPLSLCSGPEDSIKNDISKYKATAQTLASTMASIKSALSGMSGSLYDQKLSEYNSDAALYNNLVAEIKKLTDKYNGEVSVFNNCVKTI